MEALRVLAGKRIGFVGGGAMAEALLGGLIAAGVPASLLAASDPDPARRKRLAEVCGVATHADNQDAVQGSDLVVIAVKPSVVEPALRALSGRDLARPVWVSIAAGIPIAKLAALFETVGVCWEAQGESQLDAVTGLSGSGPAYVFVFLEALGDAGVRVGLPREAAYRLAFQTVLGAAKLAQESGRHPAALKDQVTSPGGTTIAGLERLEAGGFRAAVYEAVAAATQRSRELGGV